MKLKESNDVFDRQSISEIMGISVSTKHDNLDRCLDFIAKYFPTPIQVKDLAKASGMSTQGLAYAFDKHLGLSPGVVLRRVRIEYAKRLLVEQDLKLNEIAQRCGYRSVNSLWIAFQNATGLSPKKFQRRYWLMTCRYYQEVGISPAISNRFLPQRKPVRIEKYL